VQVGWATSAGHPQRAGHVNEDFVGAVPDAVVLLDGAGIPGTDHLCEHGVEWYTRRLGTALLARLPAHWRALVAVLAEAISEVADLHRGTCAIADPSSPQASVAVVRLAGQRLDVLVLGDCHVVLALDGADPVVVTDGREVAVRAECLAALSGMAPGTIAHDRALAGVKAALRARRNTPGGYWVAKDSPEAAHEAVVAHLSLDPVTGVGLLSNGVTRLVEPYRRCTWPEVVRTLAQDGPAELLRVVRDTEAAAAETDTDTDAVGPDDAWDDPDDATAAWVRLRGQPVEPRGAATRLAR
jgi:hypothetical protein